MRMTCTGTISLFFLIPLMVVSCKSTPPAKSPRLTEPQIAVQIVTNKPVLPLGKPIEAPKNINITPWQPSTECVALADEYVAKMTVAQKAGQMAQVAMRYLADIDDVATFGIGSMLAGGSDFPNGEPTGKNWAAYIDEVKAEALKSEHQIPLIFGIDAVHGNAKSQQAVVFPHNIGLGCTGDPKLVEEAARITAIETIGSGVDWAFSPVLAAARDERWGRTYEAFGETPELAATFGAAMVTGLQGSTLNTSQGHVLACAKHFAGDGGTIFGTSHMEGAFLDRGNTAMNDTEFWNMAVAQYIPAIEAGVGSIMVSYSSVNGRKMHGEKNLITNILKGTLGFNGFVVSDWKGIEDIKGNFQSDVETAINAGLDMIMIPDRYKDFINAVVQAVPNRISAQRVDDAARRILTVKCEMGLFQEDYSPTTNPKFTSKIGSPEHREIAREAVAKSLVLLKNHNDLIPLKNNARIHVTGSGANNLDKQCGGWTITWMGQGSKTQGTTVLDAITNVVGETNVLYSKDSDAILKNAKNSDVGIVVVGEFPYSEWRGDRDVLNLDDEDQKAITAMKKSGVPFVVILFSGRPMTINKQLSQSDAFIAAWLPGTEGDGIADVLFGKTPATGRLSHTWPESIDQLPINQGDANYKPLFPYGFGLSTDKSN